MPLMPLKSVVTDDGKPVDLPSISGQILTELETRTAEILETRKREQKKKSHGEITPWPPTPDYPKFRGLMDGFCELMARDRIERESALKFARLIEDVQATFLAGDDLPTTKHYPELADTLKRGVKFAREVTRVLSLSYNSTAQIEERETQRLISLWSHVVDGAFDTRLKDKDFSFYKQYSAIGRFISIYKPALNRSAVPADASLLDCVTLSYTVAQDYLRGHDIGDSLNEYSQDIKSCTASIKAAGGDLTEFPYDHCLAAERLLARVSYRVQNGIKASDVLREECEGITESAPSKPPGKVVSALTKLPGTTP